MLRKPSLGMELGGGGLTSDAVKITEMVLLRTQEDEAIFRALKNERASFARKMGDIEVDKLMESCRTAKGICDGWRAEGRQVLAMHPDLMAELRTSTSDKITGEVFRTLPYINQLVIFGDPPIVFKTRDLKEPVVANRAEQFQLLGYFTFGKTLTGVLTTTHDPDATQLGCMVILAVLNDSGKVVDWEFDKISLPFDSQEMTIEQWGRSVSGRFQWTSDMYGNRSEHESVGSEFLSTLLTHIVGSLMYLCSTTLDAEKLPTKAAAKIKSTERKPIRFTKVGWKLGPALTKARKANDRERQTGNGVPIMMPHQRRAHFAIRWTGKGKTVPRLTFIAPTWVNRHLLDEDGIRTVHPVPAPAK